MHLADGLGATARTLLVSPGLRLDRDEALALAPGPALAGRTVALRLGTPADFVRTLIALDGRVAGLVLLAPALPDDSVATLMAATGAEVLVTDRAMAGALTPDAALCRADGPRDLDTAWTLTTSGTTGLPKTVTHRLAALARTVRAPRAGAEPVWGLLYDPSRFAGLQLVLQGLLGGGRLVAPDPEAPLGERLRFMADEGVTHLSATPSLWRKLLMTPEGALLDLTQVTLGGEIADDKLLARLAARFSVARLVHIYASTEAGVGFSVTDGRAGFPADWLDAGVGGVALKIVGDELWLRPPEAGARAVHLVRDDDGFILTGDRVERDGERVRFLGRASASVNIGGTKVSPEAVEAVLMRHPMVAACHVTARPNPILGAILAASVVAEPGAGADVVASVKAWCKAELPREAQPATIRLVEEIGM
uniref:AMP-binding protein n=1 Tax=Polymorphobacter sp. TaxID=1909290 RepID=UPI003F71DDC2